MSIVAPKTLQIKHILGAGTLRVLSVFPMPPRPPFPPSLCATIGKTAPRSAPLCVSPEKNRFPMTRHLRFAPKTCHFSSVLPCESLFVDCPEAVLLRCPPQNAFRTFYLPGVSPFVLLSFRSRSVCGTKPASPCGRSRQGRPTARRNDAFPLLSPV